jgi:hypothetical protein
LWAQEHLGDLWANQNGEFLDTEAGFRFGAVAMDMGVDDPWSLIELIPPPDDDGLAAGVRNVLVI